MARPSPESMKEGNNGPIKVLKNFFVLTLLNFLFKYYVFFLSSHRVLTCTWGLGRAYVRVIV